MPRIRWKANMGLLKIFFSLLLVAVVMFASNYLVFENSISGIYRQVSENNKLVVKHVIRSFDQAFKEMNDLIYSIHALPYKSWEVMEDDRINMNDVYLMQKNMTTLVSSMDYLEEVVLFEKGSAIAITSQGTSSLEALFNEQYRHDTYNAEYWRSFAETNRTQKVFPASVFKVKFADRLVQNRNLIVLMGSNQISTYNIMLLIDVDKLLKHVNQTAMMQGTSLMVMDAERNRILSTDPEWDLVEMLNEVYFNPGQEATVKSRDYEYLFYKSDYNDFIYIDKMPVELAGTAPVVAWNRMIMIIAILSAVGLSIVLSHYLYRPIRDLVRLLGGKAAEPQADYSRIRSGIEQIQLENASVKVQMETVHSEIRRGVFLHALDEFSHSREFENRMQHIFADFFRTGQFMMAAIHLRPKEGPEDGSEPPAPMRAAALEQALQAVLREAVGEAGGHCSVFHAGSLQFLALIGLDRPSDREPVIRRMGQILKQAGNGPLKDVAVMAAVSRLYASKIQYCQDAYREVKRGLMYRDLSEASPVTDTQAIRYTWKVHFPLHEIEKLSNHLAGGNVEACLAMIRAILEKNAERHVHHHQLVPVAECMYYHMQQYVEPGKVDGQELIRLQDGFIRAVHQAVDYREIETALEYAARRFAEWRKPAGDTKLEAEFIAQYINLHYKENLHLDHMAELLGTTPKYFSNYFKKAFGINFVEYLNKVRMAHAKEWLKTTDWSVAEIGEKSGYLNSSTFTSTFKKYNGISPSEYRRKSIS
ncbi:helix-turn-helix transcriptional regulator [Paenibacillus chitinolyticus]|uniref:helix-turn-helix transcriptional regulator n=1 Tax=Paenibacillus chitinolyticus TaxID=79263 RepID=UPI0036DB0DBE